MYRDADKSTEDTEIGFGDGPDGPFVFFAVKISANVNLLHLSGLPTFPTHRDKRQKIN
jgi:hypothetical protein